MYHVPMCKVCGEHEVGTFTGSAEFCSEKCQTEACYSYDAPGDGWGYDDCEAIYSGSYSEE